MKTFLVFVTTVDGKVTKWGDPYVRAWSSEEDQEYFLTLMKNSNLVVMGRNTYDADPIKPKAGRQLVVLTRKPEQYKKLEVDGQLEFTDKSPTMVTEHFKNKGFNEMLVAGGAKIATSFLKENLIDEIWLTIEPKIFGTGGNFTTGQQLNISLELLSSEIINKGGTIINKYRVL